MESGDVIWLAPPGVLKFYVTEGPEYCHGWYEPGVGFVEEVRRTYDDYCLLRAVNGRVVWDAEE